MMGYWGSHSDVALDVGAASVSLCQLARTHRAVRLRHWGVLEDPLRERPQNSDPCAGQQTRMRRLLEQAPLRTRRAVLALKPPDVAFHTAALPDAAQSAPLDEQRTMLSFEAARIMRVDPGDLIVDFWRLPAGNRAGANVMIAAAQRAAIERWLELVRSVGFSLTRIDALPCALIRCAWETAPPELHDDSTTQTPLWGVLDVGFANSLIAIAFGTQCVYVRGASIGGDALTSTVSDTMKIDYGAAETLKRGAARRVVPCGAPGDPAAPGPDSGTGPGGDLAAFEAVLTRTLRARVRLLIDDVERSFAYAMESYPEAAPTALYVCGGGAKLELLSGALEKRLGIPVRPLETRRALGLTEGAPTIAPDQELLMASCVGLALGGAA